MGVYLNPGNIGFAQIIRGKDVIDEKIQQVKETNPDCYKYVFFKSGFYRCRNRGY